jgi:NADH-quinone oxidoreductase subunit L
MEGPTPVSALIHAATMVTAGVYMVARSGVIFSHAPNALLVVAVIGALTALFAATIGMAQRDIKRVLAYSTVSQLGYMFLAAGVAAYAAAIFHLMTHAFFKALLFLGAGSVIHAMSGEQDMMRMGGLRKKIPWTFWTMTIGTFAIAGAPPLAGFFSKDLILWNAWASPYGSPVFWGIGALTAALTSFYMFRLWFLTFFGEPRWPKQDAGDGHGHGGGEPHESPRVMVIPLAVLAVGSVVVGWVGVPHSLGGHNAFGEFLAPVFERAAAVMPETAPMDPAAELFLERVLMGFSVLGAGIGFLLAYVFYYRRPELPARAAARLGGLYQAVVNKYYVDEGYRAMFVQPLIDASTRILWRGIDVGAIDGVVHSAAAGSKRVSSVFGRMQSGNVRSYAGWVALGAALVLIYMLWLAMR